MRRFQIGVLRRGPIANHLAPHTGLARVIASRWVRAGCLFGIAISLCSWGLAYRFMSNSIAALTVDLPGVSMSVHTTRQGSVRFFATGRSMKAPPRLRAFSFNGPSVLSEWPGQILDCLGFNLAMLLTPQWESDAHLRSYLAAGAPNWFFVAFFIFISAYSKHFARPVNCSPEDSARSR